MGAVSSRREANSVCQLRIQVCKRFDKQQLLLVGYTGAGKSSLINTFNHAINMVDDHFAYQEVTAKSDQCVITCRTYGPSRMFQALKASREQRRLQRAAPRFFDVVGVTDKILRRRFDLKSLLNHIVNNRVTEFNEMVTSFSFEQAMPDIHDQLMNRRRNWSMVCVVSLTDPFPIVLIDQLSQALNEMAPRQGGVGLTVILTKGDVLEKKVHQERIDEYTRRCEDVLGVPSSHVFAVENFVPGDRERPARSLSTMSKEKHALVALNHILQYAYRPVWIDST